MRPLKSSIPIVVFAHIPLWSIYPSWGWGTDDAAVALSYLKRFGSVTVLNGHIHQLMQKVEGNVTFHTARSTDFPQPAPALPIAYREVLVLREIEGLSYQEVAKALSIPIGTVMSRLARARNLLVQRIGMAGTGKAGVA